VLLLIDLLALPWALFFLLAVQLHGGQALAIWLHSLNLFGGIQVIPRVCFTWFSLQIVVLALAVLVYCFSDPDCILTTLRRWLGTDPETLMGIVQRPIDQAITAAVRDLPNKKEVYQIVRQVIADYRAELKTAAYAEEAAQPAGGEDKLTVRVRN
jgi:hypothetical protein